MICRAPYGARGLKYTAGSFFSSSAESRPVWGAWIEIPRRQHLPVHGRSRPVWGAWIEIPSVHPMLNLCPSRAPYGARGLKSGVSGANSANTAVAPRMGRVD